MRQPHKAALALLLAGLLSLSGCASMLERTATSAEIHADYPAVSEDSTLRVESYQALVNAILYYINEHTSTGTVRLYNYEGSAEEDLQQACEDITASEPLAAYGVRDITYNINRILTYYEVELRISYAHTQSTLDAIQPVNGTAALRSALNAMVEQRSNQSILLLSYFTGDPEQVEELFRLAHYGNPLQCLGADLPGYTAIFYPEEGSRRVLEITAEWPNTSEAQQEYADQLSEAASALLAAEPPEDTDHTVEQLAALIRSHAVWAEDGADTALAALTGEPVSDTGLILAMEYLCQRTSIPVEPVLGTDGRGPWLIVYTPAGYRHLLPMGLIPPEPSPSETPVPTPEATPEPSSPEPTEEVLESEIPDTLETPAETPPEAPDTLETPEETLSEPVRSESPDDPPLFSEIPAPEASETAGALPASDPPEAAGPAPAPSPSEAPAEPPASDLPEATDPVPEPSPSEEIPEESPAPTPEPTPPPAPPEEIQFLFTDAEMRLMGYQWNTALYHTCTEIALPPETPPQPVESPSDNLGDMT